MGEGPGGEQRRILLFGATSIFGFSLVRRFGERILPVANPNNRRARRLGWHQVDAADERSIAALFSRFDPAVVIYADAVCDVPKCEADPAWARKINVTNLGRVLERMPASTRLLYLSSDHVFGGDGVYGESSPVSPISVYGRTRVQAEALAAAHDSSLIVRLGLAIGPSLDGRSGHLDWLRYRTTKRLPITIIRDEGRSAVWADQAAERVLTLANRPITGIRHLSATRAVGRPELAEHLLAWWGLAPRFRLGARNEQPYPHLGRVELATDFGDYLAEPLPAVVPGATLGSGPRAEP